MIILWVALINCLKLLLLLPWKITIYDTSEHFKAYMVVNSPTIPMSFYTISFIGGLKYGMLTCVQMLKPENATTIFYLARTQHASIGTSVKPLKTHSRPF